jgi:hypothetical protein
MTEEAFGTYPEVWQHPPRGEPPRLVDSVIGPQWVYEREHKIHADPRGFISEATYVGQIIAALAEDTELAALDILEEMAALPVA